MEVVSSKNIVLFILVFSLNVFVLLCEKIGVDIKGDECINHELVFPWGSDYLEACLAFKCRRVKDHKTWYRFWNKNPEYSYKNFNGNEQVTQCEDCEGFLKEGPLFGRMLICTPTEMGGDFNTPKGWVSLATGNLQLNEVIKKRSSLKLIPNNWRVNGNEGEFSLDFSKCSTSDGESMVSLSIVVTVSNLINENSKVSKYRKKLRLLDEDINVRIKTLSHYEEGGFDEDIVDDFEDEIQYDNTNEYTLFDSAKFTFDQGENAVPPKSKKSIGKRKVFTGAEKLPRGWKLSRGQTSIYSSSDVIDIEAAWDLHPNDLVQVTLTCNNRLMDCNIRDFVSCFNIMCKSVDKEELIRRTALKKAGLFVSDSIARGETRPIVGIPQLHNGIRHVNTNPQTPNIVQFHPTNVVGTVNKIPPKIIHVPTASDIHEKRVEHVNFGLSRPVVKIIAQNNQAATANPIGVTHILKNTPISGKQNYITGTTKLTNRTPARTPLIIKNTLESHQGIDGMNYSDEDEETENAGNMVICPMNTTTHNKIMLNQNVSANMNMPDQIPLNVIKCVQPVVTELVEQIPGKLVIKENIGNNIREHVVARTGKLVIPVVHLDSNVSKAINVISDIPVKSDEASHKKFINVFPTKEINLKVPVRVKPEAERIKKLKVIELKKQRPKTIQIISEGVVDIPVNKPKIILIEDKRDTNTNIILEKTNEHKTPKENEQISIKKDTKQNHYNLHDNFYRVVLPMKRYGRASIREAFRDIPEQSVDSRQRKVILLKESERHRPGKTDELAYDDVIYKYIPNKPHNYRNKPKQILLIRDPVSNDKRKVLDTSDEVSKRRASLYLLERDTSKRRRDSTDLRTYFGNHFSNDYSTIYLERVDNKTRNTENDREHVSNDPDEPHPTREYKHSKEKYECRDLIDNKDGHKESLNDMSSHESQGEVNNVSTRTNFETKEIGKSILGYSIFTAIVLFVFFIIIKLFLL